MRDASQARFICLTWSMFACHEMRVKFASFPFKTVHRSVASSVRSRRAYAVAAMALRSGHGHGRNGPKRWAWRRQVWKMRLEHLGNVQTVFE